MATDRKTTASRKRLGTREIRIAVAPDSGFRDLVKVLEKTFVVPEIPGVGGCDPCNSGLDRFVIESVIFEQ